LCRDRGKIKVLDLHRVEIKLGASYPRTIPEIRWITPIYHPNISEIGMVCLGGYGTHWVPSVQLDELCIMLWDMARYHNYDIRSPYNREAALWVASQETFRFPTDGRPLRDVRAALGRIPSSSTAKGPKSGSQAGANGATKSGYFTPPETDSRTQLDRVREFIEALDRRDRRSPDRRPPDRRAEVASIRQLIERFRVFVNGPVAEPSRVASKFAAVRPVSDVHTQATAPTDSGQASRDEERPDNVVFEPVTEDETADLVLFEPVTTVQRESEPPSSDADEIIFIE